jgi:hypothetical protein
MKHTTILSMNLARLYIFEKHGIEFMHHKMYERYKDEAEFRKNFVRPLLTRLGFIAVAELHGVNEFGKDFVFSELTPFGFLRHYAAVVKHIESLNQGGSNTKCLEILSQVKQAFSVKFQLPENEAENRISSVAVFISGKMSENARTWIRSELDEDKYGRNVSFFDEERLFQLDMMSTYHLTEQLIPRLNGMRHDIFLTIRVLESILAGMPKFREARGIFTHALEEFLAAPFLVDSINPNEVSLFIQESRIIEQINYRYLMGVKIQDEKKTEEKDLLRGLIPSAIDRGKRLNNVVNICMSNFRPIIELDEKL